MARFLLDTDAIVDYINQRPEVMSLLRRLTSQGETLCVCTVVLTEIYSGIGERPEPRASELLAISEYLPASEAIARQAGAWRYAYARRGFQLSTTDTLVAATAAAYGATVITANVRDYPMPEVSLLSARG
jgi:predicted nucleic acid-binding protein